MSELGMALREARVAKEITLEDLQEKTKIQKRYLQAIEEGNFDRLPGHFYTRAFIKSYAEAVGLDSSLIFETYQSEIPKTGGPDEEALPPRQARESIRTPNASNWSNRLPRVATVVIILLIAIGVWYLAKHFINGNDSSAAKSKPSGLSYHTPKDIGNGKKAAPKKQANTATPKKNAGTAQTNSATTQKIDLTQSSGSNYTYTLSGTNKFDLSVTAPKGKSSWVEIYDTSANGKKFYYGNVSNTGTSPLSFHQDLSNLKQVYMKIGTVLNADVTINGQKLDLSKGPVFQHITIIYKK